MTTIPVTAPASGARTGLLRAGAVLAQRDIVKQLTNPGVMITQIIQIAFFVAVYAVGFGSMVPDVGGASFAAYVYPGLIAIHLVSTGVNGGLTFAWDREYGFMREMLVAPVPRSALLAGRVAGATLIATAQSLLLLAAGPLLGLHLTVRTLFAGLAVCALTAAVFCCLGLLLATLIHKVEVLQSVVQLALFPMLFLSGSVFRPDGLPAWLGVAIRINPMSYAVDLLRHALLGGGSGFPPLLPAWGDLVVLLAGSGVVCALAVKRLGR
jgi:ABC-2 type transport system permease protein